jgi:hypothetical protein
MTASTASESDQTRRSPRDVALRVGVVLVWGLAAGALTSILQAHLDAPWASLVNAASPWLVAAFVVGTLWLRPRSAAIAGLAVCLLELVGYYVTSAVRGFGGSHSLLVFWGACAVVGGPVFGAAGWIWWRGRPRLRGLGVAVLGAAFLTEAAVSYGWRLHYGSSAILFGVLGLVLIAALGFRGRQYARVGLWLVVALPAGIVAEILLGLVYRQAF